MGPNGATWQPRGLVVAVFSCTDGKDVIEHGSDERHTMSWCTDDSDKVICGLYSCSAMPDHKTRKLTSARTARRNLTKPTAYYSV